MFRNLLRLLARSPRRYQHKSSPPRRTRLRLEVLEDRTVPTVSALLHGHTLNIVDPDPNGADHTINVNQTATQGTFTVQVDTGNPQTFSGVSKIDADLGADSATLNFNNGGFSTYLSGNLSVTAGAGSNTVVIDFSTILGKVSVTEGNGSDSSNT